MEIDLATEGFDSRFCRRTPKQFGGSISVIFKRSVYISQSIGRYDERGFFCVCAAVLVKDKLEKNEANGPAF